MLHIKDVFLNWLFIENLVKCCFVRETPHNSLWA